MSPDVQLSEPRSISSMGRLVIVVPLRNGTKERARELLEEGPPFELEETQLERH